MKTTFIVLVLLSLVAFALSADQARRGGNNGRRGGGRPDTHPSHPAHPVKTVVVDDDNSTHPDHPDHPVHPDPGRGSQGQPRWKRSRIGGGQHGDRRVMATGATRTQSRMTTRRLARTELMRLQYDGPPTGRF
jgi:hypothetical protein